MAGATEKECLELILKLDVLFKDESAAASVDPEDDGCCVGLVVSVPMTEELRFKVAEIAGSKWHVRWREGTERSGYALCSIIKV